MIHFHRFRKKYIRYDRKLITRKTKLTKKWTGRFHKFVCGSDQIWNPNFRENRNWEISLLGCARPEQRVSYAASLGVPELSERDAEIFRQELSQYHAISVRENSAAQIVEELIGRPVQTVLDPVMLLPASHWERILSPIHPLEGKHFVLTYVLGTASPALSENIHSYCECHGIDPDTLITVNLMDEADPYFSSGPGEFLWLLRNAALVITDSFHASAFSIIFRRNFLVFKRSGPCSYMFDRLATLMELFHLENHIHEADSNRPITDCDYSNADQITHDKQQEALDFLYKALHT